MESLSRLDDGVRPVPLEKPLRIYFLPSKLQTRLLIGLGLGLVAEIVLYAQLMEEGFTLAAWARFLVPQALVLPFALRALSRFVRGKAGRLEFTEDAVRLFDPEEGTSEIAYADISEYRLGVDFTYWFRLRTWDDRQIDISRRSHVLTPEAREKLIRTLGPRLSSEAAQSRGIPSSDPVERRAWEHFGDPPPVAMGPGKRYRYISPTYLHGAKGDFTIFAVTLPSLVPCLVFMKRFPMDGLTAFIFPIYAFIAFYTAHRLWRAYVLHRAGHDRFELTDDGIRVTRGKRTWVLRDPQFANGFFGVYRFGRFLHRYGRGLRTYYFDPRFLEEDL